MGRRSRNQSGFNLATKNTIHTKNAKKLTQEAQKMQRTQGQIMLPLQGGGVSPRIVLASQMGRV